MSADCCGSCRTSALGQSQPAQVIGNTKADISTVFQIGSIAVTNPGSCWVKFRDLPAWVPPRQYGVILPPPVGGLIGTFNVDLTQVPSAVYVQDLSDLSPALITIYEAVYPVSPGQSLLPFLPTTPILTTTNLTQINSRAISRKTLGFGVPSSIAIAAGGTEHFFSIFQGGGVTLPGIPTIGWFIERLALTITGNTVASAINIRLFNLTSAVTPSGGTVISAQWYDSNQIGVGTVGSPILALPTTKGTQGIAVTNIAFSLGVLVATTDSSKLIKIPIYEHLGDIVGRTAPTLNKAATEGWALAVTSSAASTFSASVEGELSYV